MLKPVIFSCSFFYSLARILGSYDKGQQHSELFVVGSSILVCSEQSISALTS